MKWDAEAVKRDLPDVQVSIYGRIHKASLFGRVNEFATVSLKVGSASCNWEVAWSTVARCLNAGKPIIIAS